MKPKATQKPKTQRAYGAYLDLVDTADWIRRKHAVRVAAMSKAIEASLTSGHLEF